MSNGLQIAVLMSRLGRIQEDIDKLERTPKISQKADDKRSAVIANNLEQIRTDINMLAPKVSALRSLDDVKILLNVTSKNFRAIQMDREHKPVMRTKRAKVSQKLRGARGHQKPLSKKKGGWPSKAWIQKVQAVA